MVTHPTVGYYYCVEKTNLNEYNGDCTTEKIALIYKQNNIEKLVILKSDVVSVLGEMNCFVADDLV